MLEAWLGLERRVEIAGRNGYFLGAVGVRCRRQELGLGCCFFFFFFPSWLGCMAFRVLVP